jgi:hypothetical protein
MNRRNQRSRRLLFVLCLGFLGQLTIPCSAESVSRTYSFSAPQLLPSEQDGTVVVEIDGCLTALTIPGHPRLPRKAVLLGLPLDVEVGAVTVKPGELVLLSGTHTPAHWNQCLDEAPWIEEVRRDERIYGSSDPFPRSLRNGYSVQYLHGYPILCMTLNPVVYFPAPGRIGYYRTLTVSAEIVPSKVPSKTVVPTSFGPDVEMVASVVDNPDEYLAVSRTVPQKAAANDRELLIIAPEEFREAYQPLIDFRTAQGMNVYFLPLGYAVANYPGANDQNRVRNCVRDNYANHGSRYLILGVDGDKTLPVLPCWWVIPTYYGGSRPTDFPYGAMDGDTFYGMGAGKYEHVEGMPWVDMIPEVAVARIAADDVSEVAAAVGKIILHEQQVYGREIMGSGEYVYGFYLGGPDAVDRFLSRFDPGWQVAKFYETQAPYTDRDIIDHINTVQPSVILHAAHSYFCSNMKLDCTTARELHNGVPFFLGSQGCKPGGFHSDDCIFEVHLMNPLGGAFGLLGYTESNYIAGLNDVDVGEWFYQAIFELGKNRIGDAMVYSQALEAPYITDFDWQGTHPEGEYEYHWAMSINHYTREYFGDPCSPFQFPDGGAGGVDALCMWRDEFDDEVIDDAPPEPQWSVHENGVLVSEGDGVLIQDGQTGADGWGGVFNAHDYGNFSLSTRVVFVDPSPTTVDSEPKAEIYFRAAPDGTSGYVVSLEPGNSLVALRDASTGSMIGGKQTRYGFAPGASVDLHVDCLGDSINVEIGTASGEADIADWVLIDSRFPTGRIALMNRSCELIEWEFVYFGLPFYRPFSRSGVPTPTPTPSALPGANLALNKPATESSYFDASYVGAKAVDGRLDTKWCTAPDVSELHELHIDLEERCLLTGFKAKHASMGGEPTFVNTYAFRVEIRDEGASYWEAVTIISNRNSDPMNVVGLNPPRWARYVRYVVTDANQTSYDHYARQPEFEVWGYPAAEVPSAPSLLLR